MSELVAETRYGPLLLPGGSDLISRFVRDYGEWSWLEVEFVGGFVDAGASVLDAGAFVGTFSLGLRGRSPGRVVAVEANPGVLPLLQANFERLAPSGYVVEHALLGDGQPPTVLPRMASADNLGSLSYVPESLPEGVPASDALPPVGTTLAALRERHGAFDLLKLDVEGSELAALRGDETWLRAHLPTLWVECNERLGVFPLFEFMASLGYELHYFAYPSHHDHNFRGNPVRLFALAYEAGLLAVRPGTAVALSDHLAQCGCDLRRVDDAATLRRCLFETPRWGLAEWVELPRSRLLALLSRHYRRQSLDDFITCA